MPYSHQRKKLLMISTIMCAGVSTILLVMSLSTDHWLQTSERYTGEIKALNIYPYNQTDVYTLSYFGLWRVCSQYTDVNDQAYTVVKCYNNDFGVSDSEEEVDEQGEDTILHAIIESLQKTMVFPLASIFLEMLGDILCLLAYCYGKKRYLMFVTGCIFVTSGMSLLAASVLFIGAVTGEANHQPHDPRIQRAAFTYQYQSSFIMLTIAFCLDEISGVLSVYLFIIRHKETVQRRHARLTAHKSKSERIHNYFRRQSRNHSYSSSNADGLLSRIPEVPSCPDYSMSRDVTQLTLLSNSQSCNNIGKLNPIINEELSHLTPNSCVSNDPVPRDMTIKPPIQFQTSDDDQDCHSEKKLNEVPLLEINAGCGKIMENKSRFHRNNNSNETPKVYNCKTTAV